MYFHRALGDVNRKMLLPPPNAVTFAQGRDHGKQFMELNSDNDEVGGKNGRD